MDPGNIYLRRVVHDVIVSDSEVLKVFEALLGRSSEKAGSSVHDRAHLVESLCVMSSEVGSFG
jgi:hypothetical protein